MNRDLRLLCFSLFTWGIGEGMFLYFQPIYLKQLGANTMEIAIIFSVFGVAMMAAHIPAGYLSDRIGRKPLLLAAWGIGLLAAWIMALAGSLSLFVTGWLLYGLTAFVSSPMNSYATSSSGKLSPGRAMTLISAAFNLGAVFGPMSGGVIGGYFGLRTVYLSAAMIFIISTIMVIFLRPQPCEKRDIDLIPIRLLGNQRFLSFVAIAFLAMFVMYLPQPLTPKFLEEVRHLSIEEIGLLGSFASMGNAMLSLLLGQLNTLLGFLLGQAGVALFALFLWRGDRMIWYASGYFLLGGFRAARPLIAAKVRTLIHQTQMGLAYGIAEAVSSSAVILSPFLAGALYTQDPFLIYPVALGCVLFAIAVSAIFTPRPAINKYCKDENLC